MAVRTVKVSNISPSASERDVKEFLSFSGDIEYIEMQSESHLSQLGFITFKDPQGAETAIFLSGATIVDQQVVIEPAENYQLPPQALILEHEEEKPAMVESAAKTAEAVVSSLVAKGYVLGKDAVNLARSFDERHGLTSGAAAAVTSLDRQYGLSEKVGAGAAAVTEKVKAVDERFQVSELTRSAIATAEQKASSAGSAILSNQYVSSGVSWLTGAISAAAKAAGDVGTKAMEKADKSEAEWNEITWQEKNGAVAEFARTHLDEPEHLPLRETSPVVVTATASGPAVVAVESADDWKL